MRKVMLAVATVIAVSGMSSQNAAATFEWRNITVPMAAGTEENFLWDVSCTSSSFCVASGDSFGRSGRRVLADRWNGREWSAIGAVEPAGSLVGELNSVSCISERWCMAVGTYQESGRVFRSLAERWDGTRWTVVATPNPTGATSTLLRGVDCTSERLCVSVGSYTEARGTVLTVAQGWNGTEWRGHTIGNAPEARSNKLLDVSCPTTTYCLAVGELVVPEGPRFTLALTWNGSAWTLQEPIDPEELQNIFLGVSCESATWCVAVGAYYEGVENAVFSLAEPWDGREWHEPFTPDPGGSSAIYFQGVSCVGERSCIAVGHYANAYPSGSTLAEWGLGEEWEILMTPNPGSTSAVFAVDCTSLLFCMSVGYYSEGMRAPYTPFAQRFS